MGGGGIGEEAGEGGGWVRIKAGGRGLEREEAGGGTRLGGGIGEEAG